MTRTRHLAVQEQTYELMSVEDETVRQAAPLFEALELDPYCEGGYRYRGYTLFHFEGDQLVRQPSHPFYQSADINRLWGGMERWFTELSAEHEEAVKPLVTHLAYDFVTRWDMDPNEHEVGVHPLRTICPGGNEGHPAPEGLHSDGFLVSSILVVRRQNVRGGVTRLYGSNDSADVIFERQLASGEFLIFDDDRLFHYTDTILPEGPGSAVRDVLVLCIAKQGAHRERARGD